MKLLIVDDEKLTREGLVASINWKSLGISQVFQADDGLNGLALAKKEQPEIILCDVRMPRMDGIQMAERIEAFAPDTVIIFMSGYSDKEYLKAAIKLKAVNYVEIPMKSGIQSWKRKGASNSKCVSVKTKLSFPAIRHLPWHWL